VSVFRRSPVLPAEISPYLSGVLMPATKSTGGSVTVTVDTLYAWRWRVKRDLVLTDIGSRTITGGAGSALKMGLWADNPATLRPIGTPLTANNTGVATTANNTTVPVPVGPRVMRWGEHAWICAVWSATAPSVVSANNVVIDGLEAMGLALGSTIGAHPTGISTPFTFTNDITALDLTAASWSNVLTTNMPVLMFEAA
jgi:hypothetical protein